uniref:sister chromatid cohesion protein PDS5 homolog B-like isoform X1 n=2 Tax=Myxine glutinosa TaxID=7769 RepID=UPI00359002E1
MGFSHLLFLFRLEFPKMWYQGPDEVFYPPGARPITIDSSSGELVQNLKILICALMDIEQSEATADLPITPLTHLLTSSFLRRHKSSDVGLLAACSLSDILRILAPKSPCTSPAQLQKIFKFMTKQLSCLASTNKRRHKRSLYLLENLTMVQSYSICFDMEEGDIIINDLFKTLFSVSRVCQRSDVREKIIYLLGFIISNSPVISCKLLDTLLTPLLKTTKDEDVVVKELVTRLFKQTARFLEPHLTNMLYKVVILGNESLTEVAEHAYYLILELYKIDGALLLSFLPQLEDGLKSIDEEERRATVRLLCRMFAHRDSDLHNQNPLLWQCFLGRFHDILTAVRVDCVNFSRRCLKNHPEFAATLTALLETCSHDADMTVRLAVCEAIACAVWEQPHLQQAQQLLHVMSDFTLDKKSSIRHAAFTGLAKVYHHIQYWMESEEDRSQFFWLAERTLHCYYQNIMEDRVVLERLFTEYIVPCNQEVKPRMKSLHKAYSMFDDNAIKAINEMWKCQHSLHTIVGDFVNLHSQPESAENTSMINMKIDLIAGCLPNKLRSEAALTSFSLIMHKHKSIFEALTTLLDANISCNEARACLLDITDHLLKYTDMPVVIATVKVLLHRVATFLVDAEALLVLMCHLDHLLHSEDEEDDMGNLSSILAGFELLRVLSFMHAAVFQQELVYEFLLAWLRLPKANEIYNAVLQILRNTGSRIEKDFPHITMKLVPIFFKLARFGPYHLAKHAVHCIRLHLCNWEAHFSSLIESMKDLLTTHEPEKLAAPLASLGHMAMVGRQEFADSMSPLIIGFVLKELLWSTEFPEKESDEHWTDKENLSNGTQARLQGLKCLTLWLLSQHVTDNKAKLILNLFCWVIRTEGVVENWGYLSLASRAHMRLGAAVALLQVSQEPCYYRMLSQKDIQHLALMINDECFQVRETFAKKLHKALLLLRVPLELLAIFSLAAKDPVLKCCTHARVCVKQNISTRRSYIQKHDLQSEQLMHLLPENVVPYMVHLLAHDPDFTDTQNPCEIDDIKRCLWLVLEVLLSRDENSSHAYMLKALENMKRMNDAQNIGEKDQNKKLHKVCDIAVTLITTHSHAHIAQLTLNPHLPTKLLSFASIQPSLQSEQRTGSGKGKRKSSDDRTR